MARPETRKPGGSPANAQNELTNGAILGAYGTARNDVDWHGPSRQPCPSCGRSDRDKTLGVTFELEQGVAHCFRCEYVETWRDGRALSLPMKAPIRPAVATKHETLSQYGHDLWAVCRPVSGAALAYLEARQCVVPPADGDLRWHPALKHSPSGTTGPALVALVTDALRNEPISLHRTWVRPDGRKAELHPPRMLLGGHRKAGGVIRLWPDEAVTMGLAIAEGVETALSVAHAYTPAWACIDAGNMADFPLLAGIESLLIAADHDEAGMRAARACATRWANAERDVSIVSSPTSKADINDLAVAP